MLHQVSLALPQHPPPAPPAPCALCSGSPGRRLHWAAVSAAAGSEQRLGGGLPPSEWNHLSPPQQLDGSRRPLWLQSALGSAQTAALSGRSPLPPRPPHPTQWQLRPLLYPLGPPLWNIHFMSGVYTSRVELLLHAAVWELMDNMKWRMCSVDLSFLIRCSHNHGSVKFLHFKKLRTMPTCNRNWILKIAPYKGLHTLSFLDNFNMFVDQSQVSKQRLILDKEGMLMNIWLVPQQVKAACGEKIKPQHDQIKTI